MHAGEPMTHGAGKTYRIELPRHEWPEADRSGWATLVRKGDFLDEDGGGAEWSDATKAAYSQCYGLWLGFLGNHGLLDDTADPGDRLCPDTIIEYVRDLSERCMPSTVAMRVTVLLWVIRAMRPNVDWRWLEMAAARLQNQCGPWELKPAPAVSAADVYAAGHNAMRVAEENADIKELDRAIAFRDGLILALLISRPVRLRTFLNIELDRHLIRTSDRYLMVFAAEDMKTKRPMEFPAPAGLVPSIDRYLRHHRPILLRGNNSKRLWITKDGAPFSIPGFTKRLTEITQSNLGTTFRAHAFRHIAATSIATEDPANARIIASILGHTTLKMADEHYNRARQIDALADHQAVISRLRRVRHERTLETRKPLRRTPTAPAPTSAPGTHGRRR